MTYSTITHVGSNRSKRKLRKDGIHSIQVFRDSEGGPLPEGTSREVRRAYRSVYTPHVGAKQQAKIDRRAALSH